LFLKLVGREERLERILKGQGPNGSRLDELITETQKEGFRSAIDHLSKSVGSGRKDEEICDLLKRIFLILGIKPFSLKFFTKVFTNVNFNDRGVIEDRVQKFRALAMLKYGSIRFGYKVLKGGKDSQTGDEIEDLWDWYFPDSDSKRTRIDGYKHKLEPIGLESIPASKLYSLGYLSMEQSPVLNEARKELQSLLENGQMKGVKTYDGLKKIFEDEDKEKKYDIVKDMLKKKRIDHFNLDILIEQTGINNFEELLSNLKPTEYALAMDNAIKECVILSKKDIEVAQKIGRNNTTSYLGMHDIDVYTATSMRDPINYTMNYNFIDSLFNKGELKDWNLRYFDPTQSYTPNRIQKGLVESLMIKRADVTIYNAQENDTFGKDSEAAVAMAQGKDVIIYVARLFKENKVLNDLYNIIDSFPRSKSSVFFEKLIEKGFLSVDLAKEMESSDRPRIDIIADICKKVAVKALNGVPTNEIDSQLLLYGYQVSSGPNLIEYASERISSLEKRAFLFRESHPLSFQISVRDGVAHGVIVTRSIEDTAYILKGLLTGGLDFVEREDDFNITLYEARTFSPVRIVTKEPTLSTAFWEEFARKNE
jgi:hypothetical protein